MRQLRRSAAAVVVAAALIAGSVTGASAANASDGGRAMRWCIPILMPCSSPSPTPTPTPSDSATPGASAPSVPSLPGVTTPTASPPSASSSPGATPPASSTAPQESSSTPPAQPAVRDDGAPVFTQPSAQLGAASLSFTGLPGISVVTVPMADGSRITALKITADSITIDGFALTVRRATGPALVTTADRMTLKGDVAVYVNSLSATTSDGKTLTLGADTPPPADGIAPGLVRITLGLVGATANSITYSNTDQRINEGG